MKYSMRRLLQHWTESSIMPASRERSVWRNKKPKKRTVSFVEDRSLTWSTSTSGSLKPMIPSRIMPTYLQLLIEMVRFRNSIRNGTEFYYQWRKFHLMTSWKDCTNYECESLRNSRPYWNCTIWRFIRRKLDLIITMVTRSIEQNLRIKNFEARNGNYETNAVVKNQGTKQREQRTLGHCWQWKANGQCSKGDNCSFRHDINKRAKTITAESFSEIFHAAEWEKCVENPKSWRQKKPKWEEWLDCRARITSKELAPIHSVKSGILQNACSTSPRVDADLGKSALMRIARLMNSPAKGLKTMVTKVQWRCWTVRDNWVAYFRIWSRRSLHRFCGRAQTCRNESDVFNLLKPSYVTLTLGTKIHRLEWFAQVILISVAPTLPNLGIGLRRRLSGKSDVPVKQREGWPKVFLN